MTVILQYKLLSFLKPAFENYFQVTVCYDICKNQFLMSAFEVPFFQFWLAQLTEQHYLLSKHICFAWLFKMNSDFDVATFNCCL